MSGDFNDMRVGGPDIYQAFLNIKERNKLKGTTKIETAVEIVILELLRASSMYDDFPTMHHGLSVLEEEVHELRMEVYKSPKNREPEKILEEAVQVGAMAVRFIVDIFLRDYKKEE